ncbi:hypothetical protein H6F51_03345 [Cyanobacteria bacterium FACHB-DQ100]|uniref:hypothetical protein n=1 Tax=Leptolyngbya sp. DQ-M1 TaxID=2933920 RepID=UPI0019B041B9|nr:hypothetical protein [Cyanobacteria bacterium FACHB-DQ100]
MNARTLLNLALTIAVSAPVALPVSAQVVVSNTASISSSQSGTIIPQTAGVVIKLPGAVNVDVGQKQDYPLTVPLAQPLMDLQGNEVVPADTPVSIKLKPENGGARIVAEAIVVRGQIVPIQATTAVIPGNTIEQVSGAERARENSGVFGNLLGSVMGATAPSSRSTDMFERGGMIGGAIGILSGMSSPKNVRVVQLPAASVYVLSLQAPIALPMGAVAPNASPTNPPQAPSQQTQPQFNFRNSAEYNQGIEALIKAFKQGQLPKAEARQTIVAADQYAETMAPKLYPLAGLRRQVGQLFDYTYAIDR